MKQLQGIVVSDKMRKTVVVRVDRLKKHTRYQKFFRVNRRFKAHDEMGEYRIGDVVLIEETRPVSKDKRWRVVKLLKRIEPTEQHDRKEAGEDTNTSQS
jgi:small subunit ribosomal protein S17